MIVLRIMHLVQEISPKFRYNHITILKTYKTHRQRPRTTWERRASRFIHPEEKTHITTGTLLTKAEWTLHLSQGCMSITSRVCFSTEPNRQQNTRTDWIPVRNLHRTGIESGKHTLRMHCSSLRSSVMTPIFGRRKIHVTHGLPRTLLHTVLCRCKWKACAPETRLMEFNFDIMHMTGIKQDYTRTIQTVLCLRMTYRS